MSSATPRLFCFGLGYSARAFVRDRLAAGWQVAGTVRAPEDVSELEGLDVEIHKFEAGQPLAEAQSALAGTTHMLISIPPQGGSDPVAAQQGDDLSNLKSLQWVGYLSATSVYGDRGGATVDETALPSPSNARGQVRVDAELEWLALWRDHGVPVHIFRLAGIYGPGRSAFEQIRAGRARRIDKPGHLFSRIHVDDIAGALVASVGRVRPGAIYNLCDDEPAAAADVIAFGCKLLGVEAPKLVAFEEAVGGMSTMAREFWADDRRIDNGLMHRELELVLKYPTYRDGLRAIFEKI